jgi:hypothetical protein
MYSNEYRLITAIHAGLIHVTAKLSHDSAAAKTLQPISSLGLLPCVASRILFGFPS